MSEHEQRTAIRDRHRQAQERAFDDMRVAPWIDGEPISTDEAVETYDPVIGEPMVDVPICDTATVDHAIAAAWDAYERGMCLPRRNFGNCLSW